MNWVDWESSFCSSAREGARPRSQWLRWLIFVKTSSLKRCQQDLTSTRCSKPSGKLVRARCSLNVSTPRPPRHSANTLSRTAKQKRQQKSFKKSKLKPMALSKYARRSSLSSIKWSLSWCAEISSDARSSVERSPKDISTRRGLKSSKFNIINSWSSTMCTRKWS